MLNGVGSTNRLGAAGLNPIARFNPASLFSGGEQGAWYDPSNFGTMYQDVQGTTAVTAVEQAVGLILDSRLGLPLGSERITNNTFATDTVWTKGTDWTIGSGVATKTAGTAAALSQSVTLVAGTTYRVVYTITRTAGSVTAQFTGGSTVSGTARSAAGTFVDFLTAVSGNNSFEFSADATFAGTVDNVYIKAVSGNDAYQITSASRPTLRARYNLLTYSEQFDNAYWTKARASISQNSAISPDGSQTADKLVEDSTPTNTHLTVSSSVTVLNSTVYTATVYAKAAERTELALSFDSGTANYSYFNLSTGAVITAASGVTASISDAGNGWYRCAVTLTTTGTGFFVRIANAVSGSATYTGDGTSGIFIWGAQLLTAADNTSTGGAYQRIAAATDYVTVSTMGGTVFNPYLAFDGSDDSLLTNSVDFSGTDKMTVWAGVTKLSDAATAVLIELSATLSANNGAFLAITPLLSANGKFYFGNKGTIEAFALTTSTDYNAPYTTAFTAIGDIGGDFVSIRLNGLEINSSSANQGTGNYGNYPLYIGRRNNATVPFNGRIYQLIVRGAASSAAQIGGTEQYVAGKTGVAL